jgi:hypothetical protein
MSKWVMVPEEMMSKGEMQGVVLIETFPPGHDKAPIKRNMTCLRVKLANGLYRHFGVFDARIGADLRMHVKVSEDLSYSHIWEPSDTSLLGLKQNSRSE